MTTDVMGLKIGAVVDFSGEVVRSPLGTISVSFAGDASVDLGPCAWLSNLESADP